MPSIDLDKLADAIAEAERLIGFNLTPDGKPSYSVEPACADSVRATLSFLSYLVRKAVREDYATFDEKAFAERCMSKRAKVAQPTTATTTNLER